MVKRNLGKDMERAGKRARTSKSATRAYIAKTTRQVVLRMAEKKVATTQITEVPVNSFSPGNSFVALSNIAEGSSYGQRIGREIHLDSISVQSVLHNNSTGTHLVRVVIGYILDQGTPGTTTELFEGQGRTDPPFSFTAGSGLGYTVTPLNPVKFRTVYDKVHKLGSSSADGANVKMLKIYKKLATKIKFEAATTGAANQDKQLFIGAWTAEGGNDEVSPGTSVEWTFNARLKYTDL